MQIVEFDWLRKNADLLTREDREELQQLGVFEILKTGVISLPLPKAVKLFGKVADIVGRYMEGER